MLSTLTLILGTCEELKKPAFKIMTKVTAKQGNLEKTWEVTKHNTVAS